MPKLTLATQSSRISAVLEVIALIQAGNTLEQALETVNISRYQYYQWINKGEETIEAFYHLVDESERRELSNILAEREGLIDRAITKAKSDKASIYDILSVVSYMDKRRDEIESRQGVTDNAELKAKQYLSGPKTQIQSSRLSATSTVEEDGSISISIKEKPILEGSFSNTEQLEQVPKLEAEHQDQALDPFARPGNLDLPLDPFDLGEEPE